LTALANELPRYKQNVTSKIVGIREAGRGSALEKVQEAAQDVVAEVETGAAGVPEPKPVPVVVEAPSMLWQLPGLLGPLAEAGLVVVLVIFMLVQREDLRNRLIRLLGYGRLAVMTRALDDAGQRVSRYLLMQSIINGGFGVALGIGLFVVGVPYALLWGCLAAALRFIPYVGPWMAALPPIALSIAVFPGWSQPVAVAGLVLVLELVANMVLEPWLYGRSIGVTETALLVAVAFWTWLWGPVGLLLATPLTVCLVVLGKHLPDLEPLVVLLGDEPVLEPSVRYYQRLVARDEDEATRVVQEYREAHPDEQVYDDVLLPALMYGRHDRGRGRLTEGEERFIYRETRDLVEELDHPRRAEPAPDSSVEAARIRILTCPARDEADELGLLMFRELLDPARCEVVAVSAATLSSELLALVARERPALACIGALPPEGLAHARYLCKRLRAGFPDVKIVVGRWGQGLGGAEREELLAAGADGVGGTLLETRTLAMQLVQHLAPGGVPLAATGDGESGERAEPHPAAAS
jgi:predicted PurR-regulated permease PerM